MCVLVYIIILLIFNPENRPIDRSIDVDIYTHIYISSTIYTIEASICATNAYLNDVEKIEKYAILNK